ncbi:MAG: erythromycin esterase family protein [Gemmatimonadales bacterium]
MSRGTAEKINRYVQGGAVAELLSGAEPPWRTREFRDLIDWMRRYNASGRGRIEFVGIDMSQPQIAMDSVLAFLSRVDSTYAITAKTAYAEIRTAWVDQNWRVSDTVLDRWRRGALGALTHLTTNRARYARSVDTTQIAVAIQNANVIYQAAFHIQAADVGTTSLVYDDRVRDSCMAENLKWELSRRPAGTRAIISEHNAHVARNVGRLGWFLHNAYGDDLRILATTTNSGSYSGLTSEAFPYVRQRFDPVPLAAGPPASVEYMLHQLGKPYLLLDLRHARADSVGRFLSERRPFRFSDLFATNWAFAVRPVALMYDVLVFVDRTTPTHMLKCTSKLPCNAPQ